MVSTNDARNIVFDEIVVDDRYKESCYYTYIAEISFFMKFDIDT